MSASTSAVNGREIWAAIGMFVLGFVATAGLEHTAIRNPLYLHADIRSEKLAILDQWKGTAFSASFGSSHVHNGFDPRVFDQALTNTPEQTRTINLAIAGGSQTEQRATALEFLHYLKAPPGAGPQPKAQSCMVILEVAAGANFTLDHLVHPRAINIYDWPATRFVLQLGSPDMGLRQLAGRFGYALGAMGLHYMNVGMLSSLIFNAPVDAGMMREQAIEDRRGLLVMKETPAVLARISEMIASAPKQPRLTQAVLLPGNRGLIDELQAASPVSNLQAVYIVMPKISDLSEEMTYPSSIDTAHGAVPIINLAQPTVYPQLYHSELWFDDAHLNEVGARMATQLFTDALKSWYAIHGAPPVCGR